LNDFYQEAIDKYGRDGDISEEMEKRVKRKIDLIVLPWSAPPTQRCPLADEAAVSVSAMPSTTSVRRQHLNNFEQAGIDAGVP
jgi:hypothetical protein